VDLEANFFAMTPREVHAALARPAPAAESAGETDHSGDANKMVAPDHSPGAGNMVASSVVPHETPVRDTQQALRSTDETQDPAAMPSEEDVARVLATALRQEPIPDTAWAGLVASFRELEAKFPDYAEGYSTSTDAFRQARAVLALFAPVLAEKEREIEQIKATRDSYYRTIEAQGRENSAYLDHWQFAEARALAAEAALAAERERCARIAQNQVREADSEWAEGFSVAAAGIASAIRSQGE
jgi:hypothetical protein